MEKDEVIIRHAIIHILDSKLGMPVLSDTILDLGSDMNDFLRSHIYKIASSDDKKKCSFQAEESPIYSRLLDFKEEEIIDFSKDIAMNLYTIMNENIEIPSADFIVVTYQVNSKIHLGLLKMNYKESYVHYTSNSEYGNSNEIIKQMATLPALGAKLSEAALICLPDMTVEIVEKKYDINGAKENYFSKRFLGCSTQMSSKTKLNIVTKAVEQINKKYFEEDFDKHMEAKSVIHNSFLEEGTIQPEVIGERLFADKPEIKEEFTEKLEKYNLIKAEVVPENKQTTKKFEKQHLTTDTGIEIHIPMEEYNDGKNVEFITNIDGTISVLIKNIQHLSTK